MKEIELTQGQVALVDDADFDRVSQYNWQAVKGNRERSKYYVIRQVWIKDQKRDSTESMHRFILNAKKGQFVDHINGNTLDNRKDNLRICTHSENVRNRVMDYNNKSGFKGVYRTFAGKNWRFVARISLNNKIIRLGHYSTAIEAAKAYNEAAIKYHGEFAKINVI